MNLPLANQRIVVTRPAEQAEPLARKLRELGAEVLLLPAMQICADDDYDPQDLSGQYDGVIFISANAVRFGLLAWPAVTSQHCLAIGQKTAAALQQAGCQSVVCAPAPYNSEALLQRPECQNVQGRHYAIVKGDGGRDMLYKTLSRRGAKVTELGVYRRIIPEKPDSEIIDQIKAKKVSRILVSSQQILEHLLLMVGLPHLQDSPLMLGSERQYDFAVDQNFSNLSYCEDPSDESFIATLLEHPQPSSLPI